MATIEADNPVSYAAQAAAQIHEKASTELAHLRENVPMLEQQLQQHIDEKGKLEQDRLNDANTLAFALDKATRAKQAHKEALDYANYAVGTIGEQDAMRQALTCEEEAKQQQALYEETASSIERQEATRTARLETLQREIEQTRHELTQAHAKIDDIGRVEAKALERLGKATHEQLAREKVAYVARKEAAREQLALATLEETRFSERAAIELKLWPHLQQQLLTGGLYQDELTETCERYIALIDALIGKEQGTHLGSLQTLPTVRSQYHSWRQLFTLTDDDLYTLCINTHARATLKPDNLMRRRAIMQGILEEYRKMKGKV
jgi:hypothetical protein